MMIKICGIHDPATIPVLNQSHPDLVGFVFAPSKRQVDLQTALQLRQLLASSIQTVGVFVNEPVGEVDHAITSGAISVVQLHRPIDAATIDHFHDLSAKVIQVCRRIGDAPATKADYLLYDGSEGSGTKLRWQILPKAKQPRFVAGGLTPSNVKKALIATRADGVDVSSGVETAGRKDPQKIKQFITQVRQSEVPQ